MAVSPTALLSALMNPQGDMQTLIDALLSIQTQLSEVQENQRRIMKFLRDMRSEERARISDLKRTTHARLSDSHEELSGRLDEIQDTFATGAHEAAGDEFQFKSGGDEFQFKLD